MGIVLKHLTQNSCYQTLWKPLWYPPLMESVKWVKREQKYCFKTCKKKLTILFSHFVGFPKSVSFNFFAIIARNSSKSISPAENHFWTPGNFNSNKCTIAIDIHLFDHILQFLNDKIYEIFPLIYYDFMKSFNLNLIIC